MIIRFRKRPGKVGVYLLVALLGGIVGGIIARVGDRGSSSAFSSPNPVYREVIDRPAGNSNTVASTEPAVQVVKKVGPAVIRIDTTIKPRDPIFGGFGGDEESFGEGSGFIINGKERLAVTNNHVVEGAQRIQVTLSDKRTLGAKVVGTDPIGDVALIRLDGNGNLPEVPFGDSDKLEIGQVVIAIGNPLGFENTVTEGVLSAIGRRLPGGEPGQTRPIPLDDLLQTDAAINPGNSGGPLLDAYGRVIGMNTAIISRAQGIGFAVAANSIKRAVTDLLAHGHVIRSWIGISMLDLTPALQKQIGLTRNGVQGVVVAGVRPGEPADKGGLRKNDVITAINGKPFTNGEQLRHTIRDTRPGDKITLKGIRNNQDTTWTVTIGEMPSADQLQTAPER